MKPGNTLLTILFVSVSFFTSASWAEENTSFDQLGVEKQSYDTHDSRVNTYTKELGSTGSNGVGVYGRTTNEYSNASGERDTTANQKQGGSVGGGVYIDY